MFISLFQIGNYKSFHRAKRIPLAQGFNVVIGKNNAGKSALLQALSLQFEDRPHRSLISMPTPGRVVPAQSIVTVEFKLTEEEFIRLVEDTGEVLRLESNAQSTQAAFFGFAKRVATEGMTFQVKAVGGTSVLEARDVGGDHGSRTKSFFMLRMDLLRVRRPALQSNMQIYCQEYLSIEYTPSNLNVSELATTPLAEVRD